MYFVKFLPRSQGRRVWPLWKSVLGDYIILRVARENSMRIYCYPKPRLDFLHFTQGCCLVLLNVDKRMLTKLSNSQRLHYSRIFPTLVDTLRNLHLQKYRGCLDLSNVWILETISMELSVFFPKSKLLSFVRTILVLQVRSTRISHHRVV